MPPLNCQLDSAPARASQSVEVHTANEVMSTCVTTASTACAESKEQLGKALSH